MKWTIGSSKTAKETHYAKHPSKWPKSMRRLKSKQLQNREAQNHLCVEPSLFLPQIQLQLEYEQAEVNGKPNQTAFELTQYTDSALMSMS